MNYKKSFKFQTSNFKLQTSKIMGLLLTVAVTTLAQTTPASQMETLDRGVVALPATTKGNFVSWRLLGTDNPTQTTFDLLRDDQPIAQNLTKTNFIDTNGNSASQYKVVTKSGGNAVETSDPVSPWDNECLTLQLNRPADGANGGTYTPNDMSVGDVDGDGQYELFVKWDPSTQQDNGYDGKTDKVYIDCYKIAKTENGNAKFLWRIDLGDNIRAGAHYTQFMVYDFDGDGQAEMICKTAPGTKDGTGQYVNQAATDSTIKGHSNNQKFADSKGRIKSGAEYLTVFNGETGAAIHTTWYLPGRAGTGALLPSGKQATTGEGGSELGKVSTYPAKDFWGDSNSNRSERYLAAVASINGTNQPPCAIFSRGYYTRAYVWAVSFDGNRLHTEWLHASPTPSQSQVYTTHYDPSATYPTITVDGDVLMRNPVKTAPGNTGGVLASETNGGIVGSNTLYGNGNHNLSVVDVDGDGCDEIIWGAAALDNDGTLLYATGYGHGDAMHVGTMIPERGGFQVFDVHEEKLDAKHGSWDLHDAATGEVLYHGTFGNKDNGRGTAADLSADNRGYEFWSSDDRHPRSAATGKEVIAKSCTVNFRIYWDGTPQDQLFDGGYSKDSGKASPYIQKWNGSAFTNIATFGDKKQNNGQTCNTTKATPCLQADIIGDWREELVLWNYDDPSQITIYTTTIATENAVPTLMHDHTYRMAIAWQNTAYNQPPHLGYYLRDYIESRQSSGINAAIQATQLPTQAYDLQGRRLSNSHRGVTILRQGSQRKVMQKKSGLTVIVSNQKDDACDDNHELKGYDGDILHNVDGF